ncbi:MAG: glutathione-disulfide reductase, partial [Myxococcota bacterium]
LVYGSHYREEMEDARGFGWSLPGEPRFDWGTLIANKNEEIQRLNGIYADVLRNAGVETLDGRATFVDAHTVRLGGREITAEKILIAVGGRPWAPPIPGAELGILSDDAFYLEKLPKKVVIAGGGYIGVEFAGIFNGLGVETHLVSKDDRILKAFDKEIGEFLVEQMRLKGIHVHFNRTIEKLTQEGDQKVAHLSNGERLAADLQFAAVGRRPNTKGLGLENAGVDVGPRGAVVVNDDFQTTQPNIYALGDVIDRVALTPVAIAEGMAFAKTHFGGTPTSVDYDTIPTAVFSTPNMASVGLAEEDAWHRGETIDVYTSTFRPMKHTLSGRHEKTFMKLIVCRNTDKIFGCHVVGPDAGEIIQGIAIAMKAGATKAIFDATVGIHPTAAEELVTMRTKTR